MRHLHHDHAEHDGHQRREELQPDALAALRLRGHLDPRRPGGRRDPRRPVVGEAAVVRGGEMGIRWLRLAHLKHVGADLQDCPEREVALPGRPLAVDQERDGVGSGVQRFHERRHAGAVRADDQPRRVGRQADAGQPDVAVRRRADGHGAVAEPVDDPRGGPAGEPDLDDPGRLSLGGRARRPAVERDDRAVAQRASGGRPRVGLAAVEPQRLPVLGPPRGVTEPSLSGGVARAVPGDGDDRGEPLRRPCPLLIRLLPDYRAERGRDVAHGRVVVPADQHVLRSLRCERGQRYSHEALRSVPKSAQAWTSLSPAGLVFLLSG